MLLKWLTGAYRVDAYAFTNQLSGGVSERLWRVVLGGALWLMCEARGF